MLKDMKYQLKRRVSILCVYFERIQLCLLIVLSNICDVYVACGVHACVSKENTVTVKVIFTRTW